VTGLRLIAPVKAYELSGGGTYGIHFEGSRPFDLAIDEDAHLPVESFGKPGEGVNLLCKSFDSRTGAFAIRGSPRTYIFAKNKAEIERVRGLKLAIAGKRGYIELPQPCF